MCGIVGCISKHGTLNWYADNLFTNLLRIDSIRGEDATGVFGVTGGGHVDHLKGNVDGWAFTQWSGYKKFKDRIKDYKIVVGHNRKATSGSIEAKNAHPFREKHIILVHNGAIRNAKGLADTEVDSHAIAHALAEHDPVVALGKLDGAYALVWYDSSDKTLNLARNSERPLHLIEYPSMWIISSEAGLGLWLNGRENRKHDKILQVPTEKILTFNLTDLSKGFYEIPYEEYKYWRAPQPPQQNTARTWPRDNSTTHEKVETKVVNLHPAANQEAQRMAQELLKAGSEITYRLDDSQKENGAEVLLGHPMFGNDVDENIFVRVVLPRGDDPMKYFGLGDDAIHADRYRGKIQHYRLMGGVPTIFVQGLNPIAAVTDSQGEAHDQNEIVTALKQGCSKCNQPMELKDVPDAIVRKKADGTWRCVCPTCLLESINAAKQAKPGVTLRARVN
jgi:UDP-N-acetylglucosamine transferase subunit ALG13